MKRLYQFACIFCFVVADTYIAFHDAGVAHSWLKFLLPLFIPSFLLACGPVIASICIPVLFAFTVFDLYLAFKYGLITSTMIQAIMGTNPHQVVSMLGAVNPALPIGGVLLVIGLAYLSWRYARFQRAMFVTSGSFLCLLMAITVYRNYQLDPDRQRNNIAERTAHFRHAIPGVLGDTIYMIGLGLSDDNRPAIPHLKRDSAITGTSGIAAKNIILVIGESALATHHGTYGYTAENTTPAMQAMVAQGRLCAVQNTHSSANMTRLAVPMLLSFYEPDHQKNLYSEKNLVELAHDNGYATFWIASQPGRGEYSRTFGYISEFSDYTTRQDYNNEHNHVDWRDESLLPVIQDKFTNTAKQKFFVIHLMGSHENYTDDRTEEDIKALPNAGPYDQSLHRTDRILKQIMTMADHSLHDYKLIYISDHGEVINEGHGMQYGGYDQYKIPLYIADNTDRYCQMAESMRNTNHYFTGVMLKYLLLDMMGYTIDNRYIATLRHQDHVLHTDGIVYDYAKIPR